MIKNLLIAKTFIFLLTVQATAQWVPENSGLNGGVVNSLLISGTNVFAGTSGSGAFLSTNNGTSWLSVNTGLPNNETIQALAINGSNIFAGTLYDGMFLSTNNGTNWTEVNSGLGNLSVQKIVVSGNNIFAGTNEGIYLSTNNGTSWASINSGLPVNASITALTVSGANIFVGISGTGIFLSANNGTNWTPVNTGLTNTGVIALTAVGSNVYAGTNGGGVYVSSNNGTSWATVNTGLTNLSVGQFASNGSNLIAGTSAGVFILPSGVTTWSAANTGLPANNITALAANASAIFASPSGGGVYFSSTSGTTWTAVNSSLTATQVQSVAITGSSTFAGTYGTGVLLSTNNGTSWASANTGLTNSFVNNITINGTNIFAGTNGGVYLSSNNGTSWILASTGLTNTLVNTLAINGSNLYAGTSGGAFISSNSGTSWSAINTGLTTLVVSSFAVSGTNLFAGTNGGGVFLSTNNGTSWVAVNTGLTNSNVTSLLISGTNLFAGTYNGVFLSSNNGTSWSAVSSGLGQPYIKFMATNGTNLYACSGYGGVYVSTNNGLHWLSANNGLINVSLPGYISANAIAFSGTNAFVGINGGVWSQSIAQLNPPTISSFSPVSGNVASTVIIAGTNFDAVTPLNNIVTINGLNASITGTTSSTSISVKVPTGASTGPISISKNGFTSTTFTNFSVLSATAPVPITSQSLSIKTIAGIGNGDGGFAVQARLQGPNSVAIDSARNIYIADTGNPRIRKVNASTGLITTIAQNIGAPFGVCVDASGNVYIADPNSNVIRKVNQSTGIISTVVGNGQQGSSGDGGQATLALLNSPFGVATDLAGNLYFTDKNNHKVRKVAIATGIITTIAGTGVAGFSGDNGLATAATFNFPVGVAVDRLGNIYIGDQNNNRIRKIIVSTGIISTIAGNGTGGYTADGVAATSTSLSVSSVAVDWSLNVYTADWSTGRARKINASTGLISTVAGNGVITYAGDGAVATSASLSNPSGIAVSAGGDMYIADRNNSRIRSVIKATGIINTSAGNGTFNFSGDGSFATLAEINFPARTAYDAEGNLYIADLNNNRIRKVSSSGIITTIAGTGALSYQGNGIPAVTASLVGPRAIALDAAGNIYFSDAGNNTDYIRKITISTGIVTTLAGTGTNGYSGDNGLATAAQIVGPMGIVVDASGNVYFNDCWNWRVRKITASTGIITTVAGNGTSGYSGDSGPAVNAQIQAAYGGLAIDAQGNLYLSDKWNQRIRKITASTGIITTVAGNGNYGSAGDNGAATSANLANPEDVSVDTYGNLYIADTENAKIRYVSNSSGIISTIAGSTQGYSGDENSSTSAQLNYPTGITLGNGYNLYIADAGNYVIRGVSIKPAVGVIATVPRVTTKTIYDVSFSGKTTAFAAADSATLITTNNSGVSWSLVSNPAPLGTSLYGVTFPTDSVRGFVVGSSGLLMKTVNAGLSWNIVTVPTTNGLVSLHFPSQGNGKFGYAVGGSGTVLKTINGGSTWKTKASIGTDALISVFFLDTLNGFSGGYSGFFKTSNGGNTWTTIPQDTVYSVTFPSSTLGFAVGLKGLILKTTDGGNTWSPYQYNVFTYSGTNANGKILNVNGSSNYYYIDYSGVSHLLSTGSLATVLTSNFVYHASQSQISAFTAGSSYNYVPSNNLWGVYFINASVGFAVGDYGTLLKTSNGGNTWIPASVPISNAFIQVDFSSNNKGIIVGTNGTIVLKSLLTKITPTTIAKPAVVNGNQNTSQNSASNTFSVTISPTDSSRVSAMNLTKLGIVSKAKTGTFAETITPLAVSKSSSGKTFSINVEDDGPDLLGYYLKVAYSYDDNDYQDSVVTTCPLYYGSANSLGTINLTGSNLASGYRLISFPLNLDQPNEFDVFAQVSNGSRTYDNTNWRLLTYNGSTNVDQTSGNLSLGQGYWVLSKTSINLSAVGTTVTTPVTLNLVGNSWNLIGNPYPFSVNWISGTNVMGLWSFNGTSFSSSQVLQPGGGYFVWANKTGSYKIPIDGTGFNSRIESGSPQDPANNSWELALKIQTGELLNETGGIGMHPDASILMDRYDVPVLPILTDIKIAATNFHAPTLGIPLNKDVRPSADQGIWNFELEEPGEPSISTLQWDAQTASQLPYELYLLDQKALVLINMKEKSSYAVKSGSNLRIIYGDNLFIADNTVPNSNVVGQIYPNPTASNFTVPLALSSPSHVAVSIYNQTGSQVYMGEATFDSGYNSLNVEDLKLTPGLYLAEIQLGGIINNRSTQKFIVR